MEEIQTSRSDFQNFPFYTLQELNPLDYGEIRKAASLLNIFVQYKEFYTNFNNCMDQTLDFILNNARYLTLQNSQVEPIILLRLLKRIIMRVGNCSDNNFLLKNQERIVEFLIYTITNSKEEEALLEIGKTSSEMLLVYHMEGKMATGCTNVQSLLIKCCKLFRNTRNSYLLTRIIRIILDRRFINSFNNAKEKHHLLKWVEEFAVEMLTKVNLQSHIMEICNCIIIYYRIHEENDVKGYINLQECIIELIKYRTNNPLRSKIDDILAIIVRQHYLSDSYSWPGGELALWNTIQNLPVDFKNWRHNEKEFFFIFAYLQVNAPRPLWDSKTVLNEIERYLWQHTLVPRVVLKALLFLYPVLTYRIAHSTTYGITNVLTNNLKSAKSVSDLITFNSIQLEWLLNNCDVTLQYRILNYLLSTKTDEEIVEVLKKSKAQLLLIPFLEMRFNEMQTERLLNIMARLLEKIYSTNQAFSLQNRHLMYLDDNKLQVNIRAVGGLLSKLSDVAKVPELALFSLSLFERVNDKLNALFLFCHHSSTIKTLTLCCTNNDEKIAAAAVKMLNYLVILQVRRQATLSYQVTLHVIEIMNKHPGLGEQLLKMLEQILRTENKLILGYDKREVVDIFHLLIARVLNNVCVLSSLRMLNRLLTLYPNLAHLQVLPLFIYYIVDQNVETIGEKYVLHIMIHWLQSLREFSGYLPLESLIQRTLIKFSKKFQKLCTTIQKITTKYHRGDSCLSSQVSQMLERTVSINVSSNSSK